MFFTAAKLTGMAQNFSNTFKRFLYKQKKIVKTIPRKRRWEAWEPGRAKKFLSVSVLMTCANG